MRRFPASKQKRSLITAAAGGKSTGNATILVAGNSLKRK